MSGSTKRNENMLLELSGLGSALVSSLYCASVDVVGRSGGVACLWNVDVSVDVLMYSVNHTCLIVDGSWCCSRFYGNPVVSRRYQSWKLLADLKDMAMRSRLMGHGSPRKIIAEGGNEIFEKLDRVVANNEWDMTFPNATAGNDRCSEVIERFLKDRRSWNENIRDGRVFEDDGAPKSDIRAGAVMAFSSRVRLLRVRVGGRHLRISPLMALFMWRTILWTSSDAACCHELTRARGARRASWCHGKSEGHARARKGGRVVVRSCIGSARIRLNPAKASRF
ncbi:hypothetical protein ACFE04_023591 [Oxalis oulophora]